MNKLFLFITVLLLFYACKKEKEVGCTDPVATNFNSNAEVNDGSCEYFSTTPYIIETPFGFPDMIIPNNNPITIEGVFLGEKLFHDKILSGDESQSCSSCHKKEFGFSEENRFSEGIDGLLGDRNASAIINVGWNTSNFWDGRAITLEDQAFSPVVNPIEMHNTWVNVENKLNADEEYLQLFKDAFNINYIDSDHVVMAIAQFERTLVSVNSKFDNYLQGIEQLTPSELSGYAIFNSEKGDCFHCHGTQLFMDNGFHNNGLDYEPFVDIGLAKVTEDPSDNGKFKTPTLRNIEYTAPYMHDGRFATLENVIEHYNSGGIYSSTIDPNMKKVGVGLQLTEQEKDDLIAYLKTLSDYNFISK